MWSSRCLIARRLAAGDGDAVALPVVTQGKKPGATAGADRLTMATLRRWTPSDDGDHGRKVL
jgi:hypothetical protein